MLDSRLNRYLRLSSFLGATALVVNTRRESNEKAPGRASVGKHGAAGVAEGLRTADTRAALQSAGADRPWPSGRAF